MQALPADVELNELRKAKQRNEQVRIIIIIIMYSTYSAVRLIDLLVHA